MDEKTSPRRRKVLVYMIVICCVSLGWVAIGEGTYYWKESVHHYEAGALSGLYALQTMQNNYKNDHGSYATTFSQLGLPLGAKLNGDFLKFKRVIFGHCLRCRDAMYEPNPQFVPEHFLIKRPEDRTGK